MQRYFLACSSFFDSLLSHSILLCFLFAFTLYSLNFSNVCRTFEKLSVYCTCMECRHPMSNTKLLTLVSDHFIMFMFTHKFSLEYESNKILWPSNCTCTCTTIYVNNQFKIKYFNINLKNCACTTREKFQYLTM